MDADTLEVLLGLVDYLWPAPLPQDELGAWAETFRPGAGRAGPSLSVERCVEALRTLRRSSRRRPTLAEFRHEYDRTHDPTADDAHERLAELRARLVTDGGAGSTSGWIYEDSPSSKISPPEHIRRRGSVDHGGPRRVTAPAGRSSDFFCADSRGGR